MVGAFFVNGEIWFFFPPFLRGGGPGGHKKDFGVYWSGEPEKKTKKHNKMCKRSDKKYTAAVKGRGQVIKT